MNITPKAANFDKRVDSFFIQNFPNTPKSAIQRLIRKGLIKVNNKKTQASNRLESGDEVNIVDFIYKNLTEAEKLAEAENKSNIKKPRKINISKATPSTN
jgi:23S rRNA-/tRNA-specific pseudouridylate synthase